MQPFKVLTVLLGAAGAAVPAAFAQQTAQGGAPTSGAADAVPAVMTEQQSDQVLSDTYIGAKIVARSDQGLEEVGTVSQLVLGPDDKIAGVVVDVGGFLGVGAKPVGLSWASLTEERSEGELLLKTELTREDLEDAPEFKTVADAQVESDRQMMEDQSAPTPPAQ